MKVMRIALGCLLTLSSLWSLEENVVIIIKKRDPKPEPVRQVVVAKPDYDEVVGKRLKEVGVDTSGVDDAIYRAIWNHPNQVFIDTDMGPMPLYTDVVYDASGNPQPRFPDYFTYKFMSDPTEKTARHYLAANAARWRRLQGATEVMRATSIKHGFITPEDFMPKVRPEENNARAFYDPSPIETDSRGAPIMDRALALYRGIDPNDIPRTPNPAAATTVECLLFWDWRDPNSDEAMLEWAKLSHEMHEYLNEADDKGIRFVNISLDTHPDRVTSKLKYYAYRQFDEFRTLQNYYDVTNLREGFSIRFTPTIVMIDRRSGTILREEGVKSHTELKALLYRLVGKEDQLPDGKPLPSWFNKGSPEELDAEADVDKSLFSDAVDAAEVPPGVSPVMKRSAPASWFVKEESK